MATPSMMNQNAGDHWDWPLIRKRCKAEALRVVRRHHDAEEVVQEALARAWRSSGTCRTPEAPMPWCLQITRNEALRLLGRRGALGSAVALELEDELEDQRARREVDRTVLRVDLDRALQTLTPDERMLIALRYEYDCSHPEIAAKLRIPEATARVRLHRARKRLKPLLEGAQRNEAIPGHHRPVAGQGTGAPATDPDPRRARGSHRQPQ